jgi:hypothetical protein
MRNTAPKSNFALRPRRQKWAHLSLLRALIGGPSSDEVLLGDQKLDRLNGIGKNRGILPQKFLDLIKSSSFYTRRCFTMADDIWCDKVVEHSGLTGVPCVEETPDYSFILLRRCAHRETPSSVLIPACLWAGAPLLKARIASHIRHHRRIDCGPPPGG